MQKQVTLSLETLLDRHEFLSLGPHLCFSTIDTSFVYTSKKTLGIFLMDGFALYLSSWYGLWNRKVKVKSFSRVRLFATRWTVVHQAPLSMGFSRQEYWSGLPFPSPGDLPNLGIEPGYPALQADASPPEPTVLNNKCVSSRTSLVIQWLRLHSSNAEGTGSIPGQN